jgi:dsRNA-specific ribonuclease
LRNTFYEIRYTNYMDTTKYADFATSTLKATFNDLQLLITAFTHRSYVNEHKKTAKEHNERLGISR